MKHLFVIFTLGCAPSPPDEDGFITEKDSLTFESMVTSIFLRKATGQDSMTLGAFLDTISNHPHKEIALSARREIFERSIRDGDLERARKALDGMKTKFVGEDSVGIVDLKRLWAQLDRAIERREKAEAKKH